MIKKHWTTKGEKSDKVILIEDQIIYKGNPGHEQLMTSMSEITKGVVPKNFHGIPYNYMKLISLQEGKDYIEFQTGKDSEQRITVEDERLRMEIFNFLKEDTATTYQFKHYSAFQSAKKSIIALLVIGTIFFFTLDMAIQLENGTFAGDFLLIFALAGLGTTTVILIYSGLLLIILGAMIYKMRNRPRVHILDFNR